MVSHIFLKQNPYLGKWSWSYLTKKFSDWLKPATRLFFHIELLPYQTIMECFFGWIASNFVINRREHLTRHNTCIVFVRNFPVTSIPDASITPCNQLILGVFRCFWWGDRGGIPSLKNPAFRNWKLGIGRWFSSEASLWQSSSNKSMLLTSWVSYTPMLPTSQVLFFSDYDPILISN